MKGGDLTFEGASTASVVNYGEIGSLGGDVALIARKVENAGTIEAPNGTAALAAGYEVLVKDGDLDGGKFVVKVGGADTEAKTSGKIRAGRGRVARQRRQCLCAGRQHRRRHRRDRHRQDGGRIFLTAGDAGTVEVSQRSSPARPPSGGKAKGGAIRVSAKKVAVKGTLDAKGDGDAGGSIVVSGGAITLGADSRLDASGTIGGTVLVGGDFQGGKNAATKYCPRPSPPRRRWTSRRARRSRRTAAWARAARSSSGRTSVPRSRAPSPRDGRDGGRRREVSARPCSIIAARRTCARPQAASVPCCSIRTT